MQVEILFGYTEDVIPPRCRKPRATRFKDGRHVVEINVITSSEAPVAILRTDLDYDRDTVLGTAEYRWYKGQLWTDRTVSHSIRDAYGPAPQSVVEVSDYSYYSTQNPGKAVTETKAQAIARFNRWAESFIVIDGRCWCSTEEPCYYVDDRSMSGTFVMVEHGLNSMVRRDRHFSLLEAGQAEQVAREDNQYRPELHLCAMPRSRFEILIPEVITINQAEKKRITVFGIKESGLNQKEFELVETTILAPIDAIATLDHLDMAKRYFSDRLEGLAPTILFDEASPIGSMIFGLRDQIERLKTEKLELAKKIQDQNNGSIASIIV